MCIRDRPIIKKKMFGFEKASFNAALRVEYVDWNIGTFNETGQNISDDVFSICLLYTSRCV